MENKSIIKKSEILDLLRSNINVIKNFGVRRIGIFGSVVKGETTTESDIDILIEFEEGNEKYSNLLNLYFFLRDLLGRKIDLVTSNGISPYIAPYILKEVEYLD